MDTKETEEEYEVTIYKIAANRTESEKYWFNELEDAESFREAMGKEFKVEDCPYTAIITLEKNIKCSHN